MRELLQEYELQSISNMYQLLDSTENVTDKARKEYVKVESASQLGVRITMRGLWPSRVR